MKHLIFDWIMEKAVAVCAAAVALMVLGILFFLSWESKDAFSRKFAYGYRFALQPTDQRADPDISTDINSTLLTSHPEGSDGVDENEERGSILPLADLAGVQSLVTATDPAGDSKDFYREDWRPSHISTKGDKYKIYAYATPEYKASTMKLRWQPDTDFDPSLSPFQHRLKLVNKPEGVKVGFKTIDLKKVQKGELDLPTWVAKTDADRTSGYVFELETLPAKSNFLATIGSLFRSEWNPTATYGKFGVIPLLWGTFSISLLALLIALPLGIWTAIFLSEIAPSRMREILKPIVELLASVPTVVIGYFGLMLVAPGLMKLLASGFKMDSGRGLLTAALMMALLILPTIASVAEDALRAVPGGFRDGAEALGLSNGEAIRRVIIKAARTGLVGAGLLGFARAVGETMIVWILAGGSPSLPQMGSLAHSVVQPVRGIPDTIAIEMGNVEFAGSHYGHLFLLGVLLFLVTVGINIAGYAYGRRSRWQN